MGAGDYARIRTYFQKKAITDYGESVTRRPVTVTISGVSGDRIETDGTPESITVFIVRKFKKWWFDESGKIEGGDAQMLTLYNQTINEDDKIVYNDGTESRIYRVQDVLNRTAGEGQTVYKACNLFLLT